MSDLIDKTREYMRSISQNEATGHDWGHTQRVVALALRIAKTEVQWVDQEVIELAALLHDLKDYKLVGGDEEAGPKAVKEWLEDNQAEPELVLKVVEIVATLSYKGQAMRPMSTQEGRIVQDADRLEAVGAIGIARAFAFGGAQGRPIFDPDILPETDLSPERYKDKNRPTTSLNHFYEKLLKLDGHYHTWLGQILGHKRHLFLLAYLKELLEETGDPNGDFKRLLEPYDR